MDARIYEFDCAARALKEVAVDSFNGSCRRRLRHPKTVQVSAVCVTRQEVRQTRASWRTQQCASAVPARTLYSSEVRRVAVSHSLYRLHRAARSTRFALRSAHVTLQAVRRPYHVTCFKLCAQRCARRITRTVCYAAHRAQRCPRAVPPRYTDHLRRGLEDARCACLYVQL